MQYWTRRQIAYYYGLDLKFLLGRLQKKWSDFPPIEKYNGRVAYYSVPAVKKYMEVALKIDQKEQEKIQQRILKNETQYFNGQKFLKVKIDWSKLNVRISHDGTITPNDWKNDTRPSFKRTA